MEACLFDPAAPPEWTAPRFFEDYPWIDPTWQPGHTNRIAMVRDLIGDVAAAHGLRTVTDLGCGDGSLLSQITDLPVTAWGYDLGRENITVALSRGVDARWGDFTGDDIEHGELLIATEVIEHLTDPRAFLSGLPGRHSIVSSPAFETADEHYEFHAWAWDEDGYRQLLTDCGWTVHEQRLSPERFQAIHATRDGA